MATDLDLLVPAFKSRVLELLARCRARGVEMRPYNGLRSPLEQARLWRQSRSIEEIERCSAELQTQGAQFLAGCLRRAGPQNGDHVTDAPPGLSWHQWGEAVDCFWLVDARAEWSSRRLVNGRNGYRVYADEAQALGLHAAGHWTNFKDWPHVQRPADASPLSSLSMVEIDAAMVRRFGP